MTRTVFEPIPESARRAKLEAYAAFLSERDGVPNYEARTLSRRESALAAMGDTTLRFSGAFDPALFASQYRQFDRSKPTPDAMLALLVFVKTNANEAYAVEQVRDKVTRRDPTERALEQWVLLEEEYHTRLLMGASEMFGVQIDHRCLPVPTVRAIVSGIAKMPEVLSRPITLAGEIIGVMTFLRLIGSIRRVFAGQPVVRDALEHRVTEILIDEIGHMSLNRLLARAGTFALLRGALPAAAMGTRGALPEAEALGVLPLPLGEVGRFDFSSIPDEVRRRSFIA